MLPLPARDPRYPYTVDNLLVFQMAARPDVFAEEFAAALDDAPIHSPVTLTFSTADRASWYPESVHPLLTLAGHSRFRPV